MCLVELKSNLRQGKGLDMKESFLMYKDKLKGEYLQTFDKIELYGMVENQDNDMYQERMMDLLDTFLTAQTKGMPVSKIVGKDVESFCKTYFEDCSLKERLKKLPKKFIGMAWWIFIMEWLFIWEDLQNGVSIWSVKSDMEPYLMGILIGVVAFGILLALFKPLVFRIKWLSSTMFSVIVLVLWIGCIILAVSLELPIVVELPAWILLFISGIYILLYHTITICQNWKIYGTPWKPKETVSFTKSINASVEEQMPGELKKKFEKRNKKRIKANKLLQTPEEFMAELRKEVKQEKTWGYVCFIAMLLFGIYHGAFSFRDAGVVGGVIYLCLFLLIEIPIWKLFFAFDGNTPKKKVLDTCDRLGITIIEFAEKLEEGSLNIAGESTEDDLSNFYDREWESPVISQEDPEAKV